MDKGEVLVREQCVDKGKVLVMEQCVSKGEVLVMELLLVTVVALEFEELSEAV